MTQVITLLTQRSDSNPIADMFPTSRADDTPITKQAEDEGSAVSEKLHAVLSSLSVRKAVVDDTASGKFIRPGRSYKRYRSESELDEKPRAFYETAAKTVGISLKTLVLAVYRTERKVQELASHGPKRQMEKQAPNIEDGGNNPGIVDETMENA